MTERPRLPKYVKVQPGRGGAVYYYVRHGRSYRRLPGPPGSPEFHRAYADALAAIEAPRRLPAAAGSVAALVIDYKSAPEFLALASKTRRDYARALDHLVAAVGPFPARAIGRPEIVKLRNKIAARGARAGDHFVAVASRCFGVGLDLGYVERNPAAGIARIAAPESHAPWPAPVRAAFEASGPPPHLYTGYMLALWTALRVGDVVRIGRQHDDGAALTIRPGKTTRTSGVDVRVPIAGPLRRHLATLDRTRLVYVTRADGRPVRPDSFSKEMRAWLAGLGITGYTVHGLRHTTGTALADAGASAHEIQAVLGHTTLQMAERYTRRADRHRLAASGMARLEAASGTAAERGIGKQPSAIGKQQPATRPPAIKPRGESGN